MEEFNAQTERERDPEDIGRMAGQPQEPRKACGGQEEAGKETCCQTEKVCGEGDGTDEPRVETVGKRNLGEEEFPADGGEAAEEAQKMSGAALEKLDQLLAQMTETREVVSGQLEALDKLFRTRIMHTDHEEKIVDQMHRELQKYKEDLYAQLIRPVLIDVIEVREDMCRVIAGILERPEEERNIPVSELEIYEQYLQDILEKNNVEVHRSEPGNPFVPIQQRIVKKVPTADASLHGKVSKSLSDGYEYNGKTISAERVSVYVYESPSGQS